MWWPIYTKQAGIVLLIQKSKCEMASAGKLSNWTEFSNVCKLSAWYDEAGTQNYHHNFGVEFNFQHFGARWHVKKCKTKILSNPLTCLLSFPFNKTKNGDCKFQASTLVTTRHSIGWQVLGRPISIQLESVLIFTNKPTWIVDFDSFLSFWGSFWHYSGHDCLEEWFTANLKIGAKMLLFACEWVLTGSLGLLDIMTSRKQMISDVFWPWTYIWIWDISNFSEHETDARFYMLCTSNILDYLDARASCPTETTHVWEKWEISLTFWIGIARKLTKFIHVTCILSIFVMYQ